METHRALVLSGLVAIGGYGLAYGLTHVLANSFSPSGYGEISAILNISSFLACLLLLGNDTAAVRFIPNYFSSQEYAKLHGLLRYYSWFVFGFLFVCFIIFLGLALTLWNTKQGIFNFNITWEYLWLTPLVAILIFFTMVLRALSAPITSLLSYIFLPNFLFISGIEGIKYFSGSITLRDALFLYSFIMLSIVFIQLIAIIRLLEKDFLRYKPIQKNRRWLTIGIELLFSVVLTSYSMGNVNFLVKLFGSQDASALAQLNVVFTLTSNMWAFSIVASTLFDSSIAVAIQQKKMHTLQTLVRRGNFILLSSAMIIFLIFVVYGKILLGHFGEFYISSYPVLLLVAGGNLIFLSVGMSTDLMQYAVPAREVMRISLITGGISFFASIFLIYFFGDLYGGALTYILIHQILVIGFIITLRKQLSIKLFTLF